jgi:hypothetical protein
MQTATFKLKCVGCGKKEERPAADCQDMPFCECGMPMTLERVTIKNKPAPKPARRL